jgi:flagellar basal-body rod modification protein FlgD
MGVNDINTNSVIQGLSPGQQNKAVEDRNSFNRTEFLDLMVAQNQGLHQSAQNGEMMTQIGAANGTNKSQNTFDSLSNSFQSNQALRASTLVGRYVLVPSKQVVLNQAGGVKGILDLQQNSPDVSLAVMDGSGELVKTMSLGAHVAGELPFKWDGTNNIGEKMPVGKYTLVADAQGPGRRFSVDTLVDAAVESVTIGSGGRQLTLDLQDLGQVDFSQVREIK